MKWIRTTEKEPLAEGKYFCIYNNKKFILEFISINNTKVWREDSFSKTIKPNEFFFWLEYK